MLTFEQQFFIKALQLNCNPVKSSAQKQKFDDPTSVFPAEKHESSKNILTKTPNLKFYIP